MVLEGDSQRRSMMRIGKLSRITISLLLLILVACGTIGAATWEKGGAQKLKHVFGVIQDRQSQGIDVSPIVPYLKTVRGLTRHGRGKDATATALDARTVLAELKPFPPVPLVSEVRVNASATGEFIPHLAGNIVAQDFYNDPRLERFFREIGPGLVQVKLFLADLNEEHTNYQFLRKGAIWEETIRRIHREGGRVMLHFRNVPRRLTADPSVNPPNKPYTGKAPLTPEGDVEWYNIVDEVITHFARDPETRFDMAQAIGEPNIGTNWYDPADPKYPRPKNSAAFARFFQMTVEASHKADPDILVGGPTIWFSTNDENWWDGFLGTLSRENVPLGFVSVHIYDANYGIWDRGVALARRKMNQYGYGDLPLVMTEWNVNISHDLPPSIKRTHLRAAHAVTGFLRVLDQRLDHTYFYIGPGRRSQGLRPGIERNAGLLFLRNGTAVATPAYNAFRLFTMLRGAARLPAKTNDPRIQVVAGRDKDEVLVLLANYTPLIRDFKSRSIAYREPDWDETTRLQLRIDALPFDTYHIERYRIDREHANIHTLGARGADLGAPDRDSGRGRVFEETIEIPAYGVTLLRFSGR